MSDLMGDRQIMTAATNDPQALSQMQTLASSVPFQHMHHAPIADNANQIPGFPQDAFMDMGMDEAVAKPETHGLPRNWSANMMGMMTLVRVLPDDKFDEIMARKKRGTADRSAELPEHHHE
jgi:manganese oxidase